MRQLRVPPALEPATLTFLFTDVEGCATLVRTLGAAADDVMETQEDAVAAAAADHGGHVVDRVGDSVSAVFSSASSAIAAAVDAQRRLGAIAYPGDARVAVRMGLHTGEPAFAAGRYFGRCVTRASHICAAAHGGQILASLATRELAEDELRDGTGFRDLGEHPVGERRERMFQVLAPGLPATFPPPRRVGHGGGGIPLPAGTVTFLFTDIEDSTFLTRTLGDRWATAHADHRRLLREAATVHHGHEVDTQGDSFFFVFARARDAARAAVDAQTALARHGWPGDEPLRVRMGIHTGEPALGAEGYLGLDVVRGARICAIASGGEVLLSATARGLLDADDLAGAHLEGLGPHRLKGLNEDHEVFRLEIDSIPRTASRGLTRAIAISEPPR